MTSSTNHTKAAPANFLTLPLELRQKILHESFNEACEQDIRFSDNVNLLDQILDIRRPVVHLLPYIHRHASNLASVHRTIGYDMGFVLKQVLAAFESGFNEAWWAGTHCEKKDRWHTLATDIEVGSFRDEDDDILHHRRFQMVQDVREALGADVSQFSFDEDGAACLSCHGTD
ncbi:hypothetical protein E2P81_ATG06871 [Venturia nashicola]|nr:hypothetical protein E2P81_ATG06871 [Venturia nashicola]